MLTPKHTFYNSGTGTGEGAETEAKAGAGDVTGYSQVRDKMLLETVLDIEFQDTAVGDRAVFYQVLLL